MANEFYPRGKLRGTNFRDHEESVTHKLVDFFPSLVDPRPGCSPVGFVPIEIGVPDFLQRAADLGFHVARTDDFDVQRITAFQLQTPDGEQTSMFCVYEIEGALHVFNTDVDRLAETFFGDERHFYKKE